MKYLAGKDTPEFTAGEILKAAYDRVETARKQARIGEEVPVYRQHQPQWFSPCMLGNPCEVCKAHESRKKPNTVCPLAKETEPAFMVPFKTAVLLVRDGLAVFINRNKALRLTFSKIAQLRDRSLKIDERFMEQLVADHFADASKEECMAASRARMARDCWAFMEPVIKAPRDERVMSFQR